MPCLQKLIQKIYIYSLIPVWENMLHFIYIAYLLIGGPLIIQYIWSLKQREKNKQEKYRNFFKLISYT